MLIQIFFIGFASWREPLLPTGNGGTTTHHSFILPGQKDADWYNAQEMLGMDQQRRSSDNSGDSGPHTTPHHVTPDDEKVTPEKVRHEIKALEKKLEAEKRGQKTPRLTVLQALAAEVVSYDGQKDLGVTTEETLRRLSEDSFLKGHVLSIRMRIARIEDAAQLCERQAEMATSVKMRTKTPNGRTSKTTSIGRQKQVPLATATAANRTNILIQPRLDPRMSFIHQSQEIEKKRTRSAQAQPRTPPPRAIVENLKLQWAEKKISTEEAKTRINSLKKCHAGKLDPETTKTLSELEKKIDKRLVQKMTDDIKCYRAADEKTRKVFESLIKAHYACLSENYEDAYKHWYDFEQNGDQETIKKWTWMNSQEDIKYQRYFTAVRTNPGFLETCKRHRIITAWEQATEKHKGDHPELNEAIKKLHEDREKLHIVKKLQDIIARQKHEKDTATLDAALKELREDRKNTHMVRELQVFNSKPRHSDIPKKLREDHQQLEASIEILEKKIQKLNAGPENAQALIDTYYLCLLGKFDEAVDKYTIVRRGNYMFPKKHTEYYGKLLDAVTHNQTFHTFYMRDIEKRWDIAKEKLTEDDLPEEQLPELKTGIMAGIWGSNLWIERRREMRSKTRKRLPALRDAYYLYLLGRHEEACDHFGFTQDGYLDLDLKDLENREHYQNILNWLKKDRHFQERYAEHLKKEAASWLTQFFTAFRWGIENLKVVTILYAAYLYLMEKNTGSPDLFEGVSPMPNITNESLRGAGFLDFFENVTNGLTPAPTEINWPGSLAPMSPTVAVPGILLAQALLNVTNFTKMLFAMLHTNYTCAAPEQIDLLRSLDGAYGHTGYPATPNFCAFVQEGRTTFDGFCAPIKFKKNPETICEPSWPEPQIRRSVVMLARGLTTVKPAGGWIEGQAFPFDPTRTRGLSRTPSEELTDTPSKKLSPDKSASFSDTEDDSATAASGTRDDSATRSKTPLRKKPRTNTETLTPPPSLSPSPSFSPSLSQIVMSEIYWANMNDSSIHRADIDPVTWSPTNRESILQGGALFSPLGFWIDKIHSMIYFGNYLGYGINSTIKVGRINHTARTIENITTLITGIRSPYGIFLDAVNGFLYFNENYVGGPLKVGRINPANPQPPTSIRDLAGWTGQSTGIKVDPEYGYIYWSSSALKEIYAAKINVSDPTFLANIRTIMSGFSQSVQGLSLDLKNSKIFARTLGSLIYMSTVNRSNPNTTTNQTIFMTNTDLDSQSSIAVV